MNNHECLICGDYIENPYHDLCPTCYHDEYFDTCKCGNTKHSYHDVCKECYQREFDNERREKYGYDCCPICGKEFIFSSFLHDAIPNVKTRLIANLITHYRHNHQSSWNQSCHYISRKYGEDTYIKSKKEFNNRAKRQILRKCKDWIVVKEISKADFLELQDNDTKTIQLIEKVFQK